MAFPIVTGKKALCPIVVSAKAPATVRYAALELRGWIEKCTGAKLTIRQDNGKVTPNEILVGKVKRPEYRSALPAKLGREDLIIKTVGGKLILCGGSDRGTLYAVSQFLRDELGVRQYGKSISIAPKLKDLSVSGLNRRVNPVFEYRDTMWIEMADPKYAVWHRINGTKPTIALSGGGVEYAEGAFVHTFFTLVPHEKYYRKHPEYFSMIKGKRVYEKAQICMSNQDVVELAIKGVRKWLKNDPTARIVSVSQDDWNGGCTCPKCKAVTEKEGSQSGPLIKFVNKVAAAIADDYPDVAIDTLAYMYTRKAPKRIRPRKNVIVRLCDIECCFAHPINACRHNKAFMRYLKAWTKVAGRLYVWDYTTNFRHYMFPHPNLRSLGENIRLFADNNVRGMFVQGSWVKGNEASFGAVKSYMICELMWNPYQDDEALLNEVVAGIYGDAANDVMDYINILHGHTNKNDLHAGCFFEAGKKFMTKKFVADSRVALARAAKAATSKFSAREVRKLQLGLELSAARVILNRPKRRKKAEKILADLKCIGITRICEHKHWESWVRGWYVGETGSLGTGDTTINM